MVSKYLVDDRRSKLLSTFLNKISPILWQAENVDGYFAVTGSWIEEVSPRDWKVQTALLGFTHLNNAHNGTRLGQALFKLVKQVGIAHKVW
jgi:hypothetical protein